LEIPLIRDIYGLTVLDIILGIKQGDIRLGVNSGQLKKEMLDENKSFFHYKRPKWIVNPKDDPLSEQYAQIIF
jgi:hypothetical protein